MSAGIKANVDGSAAIQVGGTDVITLTSGGAATFVTSPTTVQAGTAAAPSITFSGDTNTGIYSPGADQVAIATGGTKRFEVDAAGNAGLGVTPSAWGSGTRAFQVGSGAALYDFGSSNVALGSNVYFDGTNNRYINTDFATYYQQNNGAHVWANAASGTAGNAITFTQAMTLDASGNLGVGIAPSANAGQRGLFVANFGGGYSAVSAGASGSGYGVIGYNVGFLSTDNTYKALASDGMSWIRFENGGFQFFRVTSATGGTNYAGTQGMTLTNGGDLLVGKTAANVGVDGCEVGTNYLAVSRPAAPPLIVNRNTDDGTLVSFRQATVEEGTISVSGTTVSYNGGHLARWSQLLNGQRDESIVKGTVLSNLDEMCEWLDAEGNPLPNEQLNRTKVSDVEGDTNVAGVFVNWDNDDQDNPYDMNIAMTGDMIIRIAQGVTVQRGDLLMSAGDGTAKPQGDDIVRSKTVAKVTSNHVTCTYEDGSYCVPCVLMAC